MIEDDAVLREADELDLLEEEYEVLVSRPPHQQRLVHPVGTHVLLQDTENIVYKYIIILSANSD